MIAGIFHEGSGLGNQLHRYVASRTVAEKLGVKHGMYNLTNFKGSSFMNVDLEEAWFLEKDKFYEKEIRDANDVDVRGYDPDINFVEDNTVIDGEFQDPRYWDIEKVREWLQVEPLEMPDDVCVIGFRGGEYIDFPDLFLTKEYWEEAIALKRAENPNMRFEVHTDDVVTAQQFFPDFPVIHDIGLNWRSVRYAKHLIIANSSFFIFPALLSGAKVIAPRYWARRNIGTWALPQNYYPEFKYI